MLSQTCKLLALVALVVATGASQTTELKQFPLDTLDGVVDKSGVELDKAVSSDGKGSARIAAAGPVTVRLFETGDIDMENATLVYQARVRTQAVEGQVYLEMWCVFGAGEYFSRGMDQTVTGTNAWKTLQTRFFLKKGQNPDNVKLNLVIAGKGTAWIDDIRLLRAPLP